MLFNKEKDKRKKIERWAEALTRQPRKDDSYKTDKYKKGNLISILIKVMENTHPFMNTLRF
jgi:hypothetical protein